MKKEEKYYQIYRIHLLNGEVIEASEEYDLLKKDWWENSKRQTTTKYLK